MVADMLETHGLTVPRTLEELVSPELTALVVYDMQIGIVRQVADGSAIVRQVRALCSGLTFIPPPETV